MGGLWGKSVRTLSKTVGSHDFVAIYIQFIRAHSMLFQESVMCVWQEHGPWGTSA